MQPGIFPESPTQFTPTKPAYKDRPDFVSQGKVINVETINSGASKTSKSVKIETNINQSNYKTIQVISDKALSFQIQYVLDESEVDAYGNLVWRDVLSIPGTIDANVLFTYSTQDIFKQIRLVLGNSSGAVATVSAWIFSLS